MRDHIVMGINGQVRQIRGADCFLSLSDFLRRRCGLVGTKIVCSEGDCGSCTVLVGRMEGQQFRFRPVDSCIQFMFQLDGAHVVSVEGLGPETELAPVQQAMVDCHGSQCGFCTPGFVMAMTGLLEDRDELAEADLRNGLTGNLCRCTGYSQILQAGEQVDVASHQRVGALFPQERMLNEFKSVENESIAIATPTRKVYCPATLVEALELLQENPDAKLVAGATDFGVQVNKGVIEPGLLIDLNRVNELAEVNVGQNELVLGARTTWTEIEAICREKVPEFNEVVSVFGSPQIRHVGTIGGNIVNASPIADSLPFLFVMEAELELQSAVGSRRVNITDFYQGYKQLDLQPGELLVRIHIPLPQPEQILRLVKVSRRRDLDISTFTAALLFELTGDTIQSASLAFGAVGPTVLRARKTETFLQGKPFSEATMQAAGDLAVTEISPISDVRGSEEYRNQLTRNVLLRFYHEQPQATV